MYRELNPSRIAETAAQLVRRIEERFPDSGLARVVGELSSVAAQAVETSRRIGRPLIGLRIGVYLLVGAIVAIVLSAAFSLHVQVQIERLSELVQALESGMNDVVLIGALLFFLLTIETRIKRKKALDAIYELRVLAHVIDMHQLTKDPETLFENYQETPSSPQRLKNRDELERYLDYCSEMLSLISKIGVLYVQNFSDPVVLGAADDVESLTTALSQKIWQKIMISHLAFST